MLKQYIEKIISGQNLTQQEAGEAMDIILTGQTNDSQLARIQKVLKIKGESLD